MKVCHHEVDINTEAKRLHMLNGYWGEKIKSLVASDSLQRSTEDQILNPKHLNQSAEGLQRNCTLLYN
jgi:hypothetical protein